MLFVLFVGICMLMLDSLLSQQHARRASQVASATTNLQPKQNHRGGLESVPAGEVSLLWEGSNCGDMEEDESQDHSEAAAE